jgi:hypothetical protein
MRILSFKMFRYSFCTGTGTDIIFDLQHWPAINLSTPPDQHSLKLDTDPVS